ncbi:MAG: hypothetical protein ACI4D3_01550 [Lachnospiraceae bacterium]
MDNLLDSFVKKIRCAVTVGEYDEVVQELNQALRENNYSDEICQEVRHKQKYIKNRFSDEANKEKIIQDKQNYENHFNCVFDEKHVRMIIQQPVNM